MSPDEQKTEPRDEDVVAHEYVTEPGGDDPERKRKRKMSDDPQGIEDPAGDEFGRRRK